MGNGKRDVQGNKSFAARKVSRDKHRRRVKTPSENNLELPNSVFYTHLLIHVISIAEILTAMHLGMNQQLKGARAHNNDLATRLAGEGKISKDTAKIIRARYTSKAQHDRNQAALRGGLAFGDEGPWRLLTEVEMVEEDKKLAAEVAAATAAGAEMLKMWVNMFGGGSEPPAMVVAEEMEAAPGLDMMESEEENDEEDEEEDDDNDYNEEGDRRAAGPVRPYEITKLPFRSRPAQ